MNKNILITVVISLFIGGGIGYAVAPKKDMSTQDASSKSMVGEHNNQTMGDMVGALKDKKGDALDQAFLDGMIIHHQGAIDMAKIILANSKRPELQKMAQDIISAQSSEIVTMKVWLNTWYGR